MANLSNGMVEHREQQAADLLSAYPNSGLAATHKPSRSYFGDEVTSYDDEHYDEAADAEVAPPAEPAHSNQMLAHLLTAMRSNAASVPSKPLTAKQRTRSVMVPVTFAWTGTAKKAPDAIAITSDMIKLALPDLDTSKKQFVRQVSIESRDHSAPYAIGLRLYGMDANAPNEFVRNVATKAAAFTAWGGRGTSDKSEVVWTNDTDPQKAEMHGDVDIDTEYGELEQIRDPKDKTKFTAYARVFAHGPTGELLKEREHEVSERPDKKLLVVDPNDPRYIVNTEKAKMVLRLYKTKVLDKMTLTQFHPDGPRKASGVRVAIVRATADDDTDFAKLELGTPGVSKSMVLTAKEMTHKSEWVLRFNIVENVAAAAAATSD